MKYADLNEMYNVGKMVEAFDIFTCEFVNDIMKISARVFLKYIKSCVHTTLLFDCLILAIAFKYIKKAFTLGCGVS